ncbi:hypothetical protein JCM9279_003275 [Rhodotorula babjevae]
MSTPTSTRSLYRHLWRSLGHLSLEPPRLANLRRLLRPQLRAAFSDPHTSLESLHSTATRTLSLLRSSPRLTSNLASLTFHHTLSPIRGTPNAIRMSHLPRPIAWDPRDPGAARRAFERREKEGARDPTQRVARGVEGALRRRWGEAEGAGGGVWLGRLG